MATHRIHKETVLGSSFTASGNSPSLRRKSVHIQHVVSPTLSENNDEAERLARRRQIDASAILAEHTNTTKRRSLGLAFVSHMSAPEMKDRISECIKLNTENKISMKNAFSFQIIDLMTYMIKKQDTNMTNLQVASTSLDVSSKIYGYRVDGVYTEIMKMVGGLDKQGDENPSNDAMDHQSSEQQSEVNGSQRQKKRKPKQSMFNTVESLKGNTEIMKPSLWIMGNEDLQIENTLYQVMQSTNTNSKFYLQLYNGDTVDTVEHKTVGESADVTIPKIERFSDQEICPPLANFQFQDWSSDDAEEEIEDSPQEENNENKFQFDLDASVPSDNENEVNYNDINYLDIQDEEENVGKYVEVQKPVEKIVDLCKVLSNTGVNKTSEYSFLQKSTNVHWAGPTHWRISNFSKLLGGSKIVGTCQQEGGRKKREIELSYNDSKRMAVLVKFVRSKSSKLESTRLDWHEETITLPRDMHYNIANATKLYHHILINLNRGTKDLLNTTNVSNIDDYDYNNENDMSNYCPNVPNEDYGTNDENNENECNFEGENVGTGACMIFAGDNLINVPKLTNKISIAYSTRAKKIDMRQLKRSIWKSLTSISESKDTNTKNIEHQEEDEIKENKFFSTIYNTLPDILTKTNVEALSFPISFVSLLHLANEKTLNIQSLPDMSDLIIKAD